MAGRLRLVLGNQLFPPASVPEQVRSVPVFMAEDMGLCTYVRHHRQKIVLFLAAMRGYAEALRRRGVEVCYRRLEEQPAVAGAAVDGSVAGSFEGLLAEEVARRGVGELVVHEIEDRFFERRIEAFAAGRGLKLTVLESPMFLTPRPVFAQFLASGGRTLRMADFYRFQRRRLGLLLDEDGGPTGGRWSFDAENRRRLPRGLRLPGVSWARPTGYVRELVPLVNQRFAGHPGVLSVDQWWLPTTRRQALAWLGEFLERRLTRFGDFEDALSGRDPFLFHSVLSPVLNLGLITPGEVVDRAVGHAAVNGVPINALEGFVRQVIGWREWVRGMDRHFGERQAAANHFGHRRELTGSWWTGTTGLDPLDEVIGKALRFGWCHHIERLMVVGNLMTLCEIRPSAAYDWFMSMFVDSSDWVMGPNVYGMGIFSDGGIFATKPYVCGSNYLLKMGDAARGSWCEVVDGLYWRFVDRHRDRFAANPRTAMMVRSLDGLDAGRVGRIFGAAEDFLERMTR